MQNRKLAVITGASSGIGYELAACCARDGLDLVIAADRPEIDDAAARLRELGAGVDVLQADLSTTEGVDALYGVIAGRRVDVLLANAGHGLGHAFLDQDFNDARHVFDTNVTGTLYLIHRVGRDMRARGWGRILITGSIAGFMPGSFAAVYNGSKAFLDSFAYALRNELEGSGVTVTCLMPGATDTGFYARAGLLDTAIGRARKDDPADVARTGFEAMMKGESGVVTGVKSKLQAAVAHILPAAGLAEIHRREFEPDSAE